MATKTPTTKKPSGLSIARSSNKFTFSWKRGSSYGYQQFQYAYKGKWISGSVLKTDTSKSITISNANLTGAKYIKFRVRGKDANSGSKKPKWSAWTTYQVNLKIPVVPVVTFEVSTDTSNVGTPSWTVETATNDFKPFLKTEYQSILSDSPEQPSDVEFTSTTKGWETGEATESGTVTITEDTTEIAAGSRTRWIRVRSVGTAGNSEWVYSSHVYALAGRATVLESNAQENGNLQTTEITVSWRTEISKSNPVDKSIVQYSITTPTETLDCPDDASWTDGITYNLARENDSAHFSIDGMLTPDKCLFARVNTVHDNATTYGEPQMVLKGVASDPTFTTLEVDTSTSKVTITATNNSEIPGSYIRCFVRYETGDSVYIGDIESGETSATLSFVANGSTYAFAIQSVSADGSIVSGTVVKGGDVPLAPTNVTASVLSNGSIRVTWDWTWESAQYAQIGWAENDDAWESTDEPTTYNVSSLHASAWNIAGLATGQKWYIRVRLADGSGDNVTYSPWSDMITVNLTEAPTTPTLTLSSNVVTKGGSVTASWAYTSGDGTAQAYAEICEAYVTRSGITYGDVIAHATTAQSLTIDADLWETGTTHYLCVRVTSASGVVSDSWSLPVALTVAEAVNASITTTSLESITIDERQIIVATQLPITVSTSGAGDGGTTTICIERAADYHLVKPDENEQDGFEGETIALVSVTGDEPITISSNDLIGTLDDGGLYRIIATVQDSYGQSASDSIEFEVHYSHQPTAPTATAEVDGLAVKITPMNESAAEDDTVDIYRLSIDEPELIVSGGTFGTTYVDPYPAFGEDCGHRVVTRTASGDYITEDDIPAWIDLDDEDGDIVDGQSIVIDFNGGTITLPYNISLDNSWTKDFEQTKYLGGSIEGDWNPGVTRSLTATSDLIRTTDAELIADMRRLAIHSGICHVRTPEGSSFSANVSVSENQAYESKLVSYSLTINRVDSEGLDGMTLAEWNEYQGE